MSLLQRHFSRNRSGIWKNGFRRTKPALSLKRGKIQRKLLTAYINKIIARSQSIELISLRHYVRDFFAIKLYSSLV